MENRAMRVILRLEGLALGLLCIWLYKTFHHGWLMFALLFLAPDLSMLGYLLGPRVGAAVYNLAHSWTTVVVAFFVVWFLFGGDTLLLALITILGAHIGIDRALGYGLKLPTGFRDTHLGRIGKAA
jgi:hypothetical protein